MTGRLVILGSSVTALAVARDAHAHGLRPIVIDAQDGIAFRSRHVESRRVEASASLEHVLAAVRGLGGDDSWLIATADHWLRVLLRNRASLDEAYRAVLHPAPAVLEICLNKRRFAQWCQRLGLPTPRIWVAGADERPGDFGPPFLIRPAETRHEQTSGLPKAVHVASESELSYWLARFAEAGCQALVSESLLGRPLVQFSVPFARAHGQMLTFVARKLRPAPERCAVGSYVELAPAELIEAIVRRAVEALDYFGVGEAEVLYAPGSGQSYLIEINARPWLQYALAPKSGHDFLGLVTGRPWSGGVPVKEGCRWLDLQADLFAAFSRSEGAVRRGELGLIPYLRSLIKANVFARFDWRDPAPALYKLPQRGEPRTVGAPD